MTAPLSHKIIFKSWRHTAKNLSLMQRKITSSLTDETQKKLFKDKILITTPKGKKNHKKRKSVELKSDLVGMEVKVPPFTSASVFTPTDILIASNKSHKVRIFFIK